MQISNFHEILPLNGEKPKRMMVLLHGYGANGDDMADIAYVLRNFMPDCLFVTPDAPVDCPISPDGKQWFPLKDWSSHDMIAEAVKIVPVLQSFITEQLEKHRLKSDSVFIGGFSQGAALSLLAAMKNKEQIAGVLAYSGWLIDENLVTKESQSLSKPPMFIIHGDRDEVVPLYLWEKAKKILAENGFDIDCKLEKGLAHSISMGALIEGAEFANRNSS